MKIDNKKKKIIIIAAVIILVAAIATTVGILCSKKAKQSENTESQTVTVDVTDENGEIVTDENGNAVTEVEPATDTSKKADNSDKDETTTKSKKTNGKNETTTEPPTEFTTIDPKLPIELPALPDEDYALTESLGLYVLENYYGDEYVVNYDMKNWKDDDITYTIFVKNEKKTDIAYNVVINMETGKAQQTDAKGKVKDITEDLKKFY